METSRKTIKPSIKNRGTLKTKQEQERQIYDADAELALALSTSNTEVSGLTFATNAISQDDFEHQQHLILLKHQEEADAEYARQLAAEFESNPHPNPHHNPNLDLDGVDGVDGVDGGDDMDAVLEEIARMEAQERLKATGHAYNGKTNINRILADEDEEEARIREKVKRDNELNEWRAERERQDAEYAAMEEYDRNRELSKKNSETIVPTTLESQNELEFESEPEYEEPKPEPLTKDELRRARLAFFTSALANANQQKS